MQAVGVQFAASPGPGLRRLLREEHCAPFPSFSGFQARHWRMELRALQGRYLVHDPDCAAHFVADPLAADPAIWRLGAQRGVRGLTAGPIEAIPDAGLAEPVFIVSAPRAGSTLLYELLAEAADLWSIGRESEGLIEGIPRLHPAAHGYQSHRLTEIDRETAHTLRASFLAELRDRWGRRYLALPADQRPHQVRMLEKTPENALRIPLLAAAFPGARFLYLAREARQNVSSMVEAWQHPGFVNIPILPGWGRGAWHLLLPPGWQQYQHRPLDEIAAFQWASANQAILDDLAHLPDERWMTVDYQALLAQPEPVLRRVCRFLGVAFDPHLAEIARRPLRLSGTTIRPPSPSRWRFNPHFREQVLQPFASIVQRVEEKRNEMATTIQPRKRIHPVQFRCFLDELDGLAETTGGSPADGPGGALVVDPTFHLQVGMTIPLPLLQRARFRERFETGTPIAWVEDPATRTLRPFWVRRRETWLLRALRAGAAPVDRLPDSLERRLRAARILLTDRERAHRAAFGDHQARAAAASFAERDLCVIDDLLHPAHLRALGRYYRALIRSGRWDLGDAQVTGRYGWHNELLARFFHHQFTDYIGRAVGRRVKPSYAYVSAYQEGAVLERHLDREQCEYTVSLLVERTPADTQVEWPIYFDTPQGTLELFQSVGQAIVFRGTKLPHYRPQLPPGQTYLSLLFHYVPADFKRTLY